MSDTKTTEEVLGHHLESFGARNVDAIMEDYTEDSVLMTPDTTLTDLASIRALYEEFTTNMLPVGAEFEMIRQEISSDVAFIVWKAESETLTFHIATDTFIVKDGKIATQTFAGHITPK